MLSTLCEFIDIEFDGQKVDIVEVSHMLPLVDRFSEYLNMSLNSCRMHIEHNDFEALDEQIHQMLGACGVFGATPMYTTLKKVKGLLNENKLEPLPLLLLLTTVADELLVYRHTVKQ